MPKDFMRLDCEPKVGPKETVFDEPAARDDGAELGGD